jgi:hypothetical protein
MKRRILQQVIAKLESPKQGNRITWDREVPGFGVTVTSAGVISFVLEYRIHGRKRRYTIGRYPELTATAARERAMQLRVGIMDGYDPLEVRQQDRLEPTVNDLSLPETRFLLCRLHFAPYIGRLLGDDPGPGFRAHFLS